VLALTKVILITGLLAFDSGKTWFTYNVANYALSRGLRVSIYKPVAGHDAWTQHHTIEISRELKLLLGHDVSLYAELLKVEPSKLHLVNPVDLLLSPLDVELYLNSIESFYKDMEDQFSRIVLSRVSNCRKKTSSHFLVRENIAKVPRFLRDEISSLAEELSAEAIDLKTLLSLLTSREISIELNYCLEELAGESDLVLVESFNNAVLPYIDLRSSVRKIVVVSVGKALIYDDPGEVWKVIDEGLKEEALQSLITEYFVGRIKPSIVVDIRPRKDVRVIDEGSAIEVID